MRQNTYANANTGYSVYYPYISSIIKAWKSKDWGWQVAD